MKKQAEFPIIVLSEENLCNRLVSQYEQYLARINEIASIWNEFNLDNFSLDHYSKLSDFQWLTQRRRHVLLDKMIKSGMLPDLAEAQVKIIPLPEKWENLRNISQNWDFRKSTLMIQDRKFYDFDPNWLVFPANGEKIQFIEGFKDAVLKRHFQYSLTGEGSSQLVEKTKQAEILLNEISEMLSQLGILDTRFNSIISSGNLFVIGNDNRIKADFGFLF